MITKFPLSDILPVGACEFSRVLPLLECRAKSRLPQNAKSVITYLFPYYLGEDSYKELNISKYAVSEDYHTIAGMYLQKAVDEFKESYPHNEFVYFCDNSPIRERDAAMLCGLGVKGRNGLLINEKYGSFCFIGEIVTDAIVKYSMPEDRTCLNCGACERNCPNGALHSFKVDISKCLSDVTQRKKITDDEALLIKEKGSIWGCDRCQDICPMNKNVKVTPIKEFIDTARPMYKNGDSIEGRAYAWRGESVIKRNFEIKYCNKR